MYAITIQEQLNENEFNLIKQVMLELSKEAAKYLEKSDHTIECGIFNALSPLIC